MFFPRRKHGAGGALGPGRVLHPKRPPAVPWRAWSGYIFCHSRPCRDVSSALWPASAKPPDCSNRRNQNTIRIRRRCPATTGLVQPQGAVEPALSSRIRCTLYCSISSFIRGVDRDDPVVAGKDNVERGSEQRILCHSLTRLEFVVASPPGVLRGNVSFGIER